MKVYKESLIYKIRFCLCEVEFVYMSFEKVVVEIFLCD